MQATLTSKGQMTLPLSLRKRWELHAGDRIRFIEEEDGSVSLVPLKTSVKKLKGFIKSPKKGITLKAMQEAIEKEGSGP